MKNYIAPEYKNEKVIIEDVIAVSLFSFIFGKDENGNKDGSGDVVVDLGNIL